MLLRPNKTKFNKYRRGWLKTKLSKFYMPKYSRFALISAKSGLISARVIECCRQLINRHLKRKNKIWISIFPDVPFTSKPLEVRMGKGKGNIDAWYARVCAGKILFEVEGSNKLAILTALNSARKKLPLKTFVFFYPFKQST